MIQIEQLTKEFSAHADVQTVAVDSVSLSISKGAVALITGDSGSGKTTLLSLIGALTRPTSGSVCVLERDLTRCSGVELARLRRQIGFVFQSFSLIPRLPIWENVSYPLIPQGTTRSRRLELAREMLARMGLAERSACRPEQLSGGEQQRVALARALVGTPRLLLADEPTSNLDARSAEHMIKHLLALNAAGMTLVLATHDPRLIEIGTHVFHMDMGKLSCV